MPDKNDHLRKARENEKFAASLDLEKSIHVDWALNAMFYSALHYIEAYFAKYGIHGKKHDSRDTEIARDPRIDQVYGDYRELKDLSFNARYETIPFTKQQVRYAQPRLSTIKSRIEEQLRP